MESDIDARIQQCITEALCPSYSVSMEFGLARPLSLSDTDFLPFDGSDDSLLDDQLAAEEQRLAAVEQQLAAEDQPLVAAAMEVPEMPEPGVAGGGGGSGGGRRRSAGRPRPARLLLWQFLLQLLLGGHSSLAWVDDQWSRPGVFVFKDPNEAARQWGGHKGNRNMSYEKLSRCVRDYFTRRANRHFGVMLPDGRGKDHRRLHFAFNLQSPDVQQFIRSRHPAYYHNLITKEIVKHHH